MSQKQLSSGDGMSLGGVLFIVFLVLKLCHVINWSWWWVTAPIWIPIAILLLIYCIGFLYILIEDRKYRGPKT